MHPGLRLRQVRERLGLTYREVEQASFEVAGQRGRGEFIVHISRLADIENAGITPSLHKLYSLCAIYHLDAFEVCNWYGIPLAELFDEGLALPVPQTHLAAPPRVSSRPESATTRIDSRQTIRLSSPRKGWGQFESALCRSERRYYYGLIGTEDRWMGPLVRPGSLVLVDPSRHKILPNGWKNEYERPIYFVDVRDAYRCCWCSLTRHHLVLQPHPLSPCAPEQRRFPEEAEIVGQVVGIVMRLDDNLRADR